MKILQVINSLATGGAEKLLLDTVPKYNAKGIEMDVLVLQRGKHPFYLKLEEQKVCTLYHLGSGSVYNPLHIFRLLRFFKKYDLLHVHLFPSLYWVAYAKVLSFSKTPLVYTEHNTSNRRRDHWFFSIMDSFVYKRYSRIITISSEVDAGIKKHLKFPDATFSYIQNGVAISEIYNATPASRESFNIPKENKVIIQVASFTPQKDQVTLIKAIKILPKNTSLLLVGDGPTKVACETFAKALNLEEQVQFLGIRMNVPELLKMADVVVLSTHYEGLSLSSIEALASGRPFVASKAPGLAPMVQDAGLLFKIGASQELADHIELLFSDRNHYDAVVAACLKRAQQFTIEKMIDNHIALYRDLAKSKSNKKG